MNQTHSLSRRGFLASASAFGGGLLLGVSFSAAAGKDGPFKPNAYIEIDRHGQVTLTVGKSEMGQGNLTGIAQLIADELGCAWAGLNIRQATAAPAFGFPFNGFMITGGSSGLRTEWKRMRTMGATARLMLQQAAAAKWATDVASTSVKEGVVSGPAGQKLGFGDLAAEAAQLEVPKPPALKSKDKRTLIGKPVKRWDTAQKVTGRAQFGMDVDLPGLLTAVVIMPPQLGAPVKSFNGEAALKKPGVKAVVQISSGVAIVAEHYWAAHSARDDVDIEWGPSPFAGLGMEKLRAGYQAALKRSGKIAEAEGTIETVPSGRTVTREVEQPYLAHACMEPMNFTVWIKPGSAQAWGPTQAQSFVQGTVAKVAGLKPDQVEVHTTFLGGGFGRRSAQDFVQAAAEISAKTNAPVKLVYSREDDMRAARFRPFNLTRATGSLDAAGKISTLDVKVATPSVAKWSGLKFLIDKNGLDKQAVEGLVNLPYDIANRRVEWVDEDPQVPIHFWRAVGSSHNPFVIETLMDELAKMAGQDPMAFRRRHLEGKPRHLAVLDKLAQTSNWAAPAPAGTARGMALVASFESIVGQVADVSLEDGAVKVGKVSCVIDCGVAVNPGQIEAQMQGSIVYGLSALLRGEITLEDGQVEQSNFHDYEPLRMPEMPQIDVHILEGADAPGGVGEPGLPPLLPAVANALFALDGKKITRLPLSA